MDVNLGVWKRQEASRLATFLGMPLGAHYKPMAVWNGVEERS